MDGLVRTDHASPWSPAIGARFTQHLLKGHKKTAYEFARHDFVGFEGTMRRSSQEQWLLAQGAVLFPFRSNSDAALLAAAADGQGLCITVDAFAREVPELRRVTCELPMPGVNVYLAMHRSLRDVPRVRGVMRVLEQAVRELAARG